ncbi:hypothetical protein KIK06_02955 [Nocardiopsis sp. EMB25]|uniref:hypothetical protein n=1 Tax=Nocardiopsis sp. EMB25 TaxID=2835867 RepID=UPI002283811B|nr:hypothetical protein [Nocardiopsis sp. EMB25]MCY9782847.1 hypothetical protein [Nocardiopsis sp. EMB25]
MDGLLWEDVEDLFDAEVMGALPDVGVPDTSARDWQSLLDLVVERGWRHRYSEDSVVTAPPSAEAVLSRLAGSGRPELRVWPTDDVLAIFRFMSPEEIDFDVDLRELRGQERLDVFCDFLCAIGRRLGKPVLMGSEGGVDYDHPALGFDVTADRVVRMASRDPQR